MSMLYSIELIMDGNISSISKILDTLSSLTDYEDLTIVSEIKDIKSNILKITNSKISRVFLNFTISNTKTLNLVSNLSFEYPDILFWIRTENDMSFTEKKYKKGLLLENLEFSSLIKWRLHTQNMFLNSEEVREFIENDLEYLVDELESYNEFEIAVLKEFKDVEYTKHYTKNDLMKDIELSYNELFN